MTHENALPKGTIHENALPKAVRDQISQADEIYNEVYAVDKPPESDDNLTQKPEPDTPPEPESEESFEHKFRVLQGKYNKEVPRLHHQLRESQQKHQQLTDRFTQMEVRMRAMQEDKTKEPPAPALTQEEIDQFGPDLIDIIRRVAKQETGVILDDKLKPVTDTVKQVQETVAHDKETVAESAHRQMLTDLATAVPDWEQQNGDEEFLDWLNLNDPYTGRARAELLADAYRKNDGKRLVAIFQGFQKENAVVTPTDQQQRTSADKPSDTPAKQKSPDGLNELVAPGTPKTGSAGAQNESGKKIWTKKEVQDFYAYKNEFIKKHPERDLPENVLLAERDLFKAQSEGRIKP